MKQLSVELIQLQRDELIVHPAVRHLFEFDQYVETEVNANCINQDLLASLQITQPLIVVQLENSPKAKYGIVSNWQTLGYSSHELLVCLSIGRDYEIHTLESIAVAGLLRRFLYLPRLSQTLAKLVELADICPHLFSDFKSKNRRKNASKEKVVAEACLSSLSTVRSQVRTLRENRKRILNDVNKSLEEVVV